ncbi:hypothetical protein [Flavobacterium sp. H4147]|uniref:hypothetical protein n=1 Tax=Flavobacterium sp. H4147 TaxID=3034149 RepID=UPI0023ECCC86|nr:hypothetical protein [Flavobacterium sp. H4147]
MKKNLALTFWALYMLFFAIPFPMFLYYNIKSESDIDALKDGNPYLALAYLALSILLWLILLVGYFRKWILQLFITRRNMAKIKAHGVLRESKILNAQKISKATSVYNTYELELCFKNLSDSEITHKTTITDLKPLAKRFESGNKLNILLDRDMNQPPYMMIASSEASINFRSFALRILGFVILSIAVIAYYIFSYRTESYGMGWRFLAFWHPLILCPAILLFYRILVGFIFRKITGLSDDSLVIKFKGIKTSAKLIKVSQTGTYINEQPMMRFELEYTDTHNQLHRSSLKKVVGLLDLDITKQEYISIFYLPENPSQIAFTSDLNTL